MRRVRLRGAWLALCASGCAACMFHAAKESAPMQVERRIPVPTAHQGVAVEEGAFYAIDSRGIEKYDLHGKLRASYDAGPDSRIIHLNGCTVHAGVLYCAHSNYPAVPMQSSIERFDAVTLVHLGSRKLDDAPGSATWVDRTGDRWLVAFANYAGKGGEPGRGPEATRLVAYDTDWRHVTEYLYPEALVARFGDFSNSGGVVKGDRLLLTGHDASEVYVACLDDAAGRLRWLGTWPAPFPGQGIAWDARRGTLWGIVREKSEVVEVGPLPPLPPEGACADVPAAPEAEPLP